VGQLPAALHRRTRLVRSGAGPVRSRPRGVADPSRRAVLRSGELRPSGYERQSVQSGGAGFERRYEEPLATGRGVFGKRNRKQLVGIAKECGYADGNGSLGSYKKSELTSSLVRHFVNAHSTAEPTEAQRKAREWLPEAMLFPAVDRDAPAEAEVDEQEEDIE